MSVLEVHGVCRTFGGLRAVDDVNLSVGKGEVHGLIGPNGAGKTTLFSCLSGHVRPTAGSVVLDGTVLTGAPPYVMARHGLARTFQNMELFSDMTVLENVMVGRHLHSRAGAFAAMLRLPPHLRAERESRLHAAKALARVGLADLAQRPVSVLSHGQQRRVEIARALALEPLLLLLDEPAAGLSTGEASDLAALIRDIAAQGTAVMIVEHDMRTLMSVAEQITVLDSGRLIAQGPPSVIRHDEDVIRAYLGASWRPSQSAPPAPTEQS